MLVNAWVATVPCCSVASVRKRLQASRIERGRSSVQEYMKAEHWPAKRQQLQSCSFATSCGPTSLFSGCARSQTIRDLGQRAVARLQAGWRPQDSVARQGRVPTTVFPRSNTSLTRHLTLHCTIHRHRHHQTRTLQKETQSKTEWSNI